MGWVMRWSIPVTSALGAAFVAAIALTPAPAAAQRFGGGYGGFRGGYGGGGYGGFRGGYGGYGGYRGYGFGPAFGIGVGAGLLAGRYYSGYAPGPYYVAPPVVYAPPPPVVYEPPVAYVTPAPRRVRPRPVVHHVAAQCVRVPAAAEPASPPPPAAAAAVAPRHDVYPPESP